MKKSHDNHMKHTKEITPLRHLQNATGHQHVKRRRINDVITSDRQQNFSQDEEELIVKLHALLGNNRWSLIAGRLPGRTEEEVKKYWNSQLKEKLVSMGIDPNNHHVNQAICRPSSSSSCSCSLNHNHQTDDLDETTSSQHK